MCSYYLATVTAVADDCELVFMCCAVCVIAP